MRVPPFRLHVFVVLYEHSKAYAGLPVAVIVIAHRWRISVTAAAN
jgi:hypothetical protein